MAQMTWVYLDPAGGRHRVGLYHGDRTGHLLIHCNSKIVQVDFAVKATTYYSFFVEDELCEIHLVKEKDGRFGYEFKINKEVDTPLNQLRKRERKVEFKHLAIGVGIMVLFIGLVFAFNRYQANRRVTKNLDEKSIVGLLEPDQIRELSQYGKWAPVTFFITVEQGRPQAYYTFQTKDGQSVSGKVANPNGGALQLPTGFVLKDQHVFKAMYLPNQPMVHRVDFSEPDPSTLADYVTTAIHTQQQLHPESSDTYNRCVVETITKVKTWKALATIMQQKDNTVAQDAYLRLVRDPEVARMVKQSCDF
jgi:hypothetical protein